MRLRKLVGQAVRRARGEHGRYFLLDRMPDEAVCAEIGVWRGEFSEQILKYTHPSRLYLIDPWTFQPEFSECWFGGEKTDEQLEMEAIYRSVARRLGRRPDVEIIRDYSVDALQSFEDDALDWVYIDGNHHYEYIKQDLAWCQRKVRPGGYITGDDYEWGAEHGYPVKRAVNEFLSEHPVVVEAVKNNQYILKNVV